MAVLDWDSHRFLESFFAVPMLGAVLHTVNVRLSADQLVYTINHAEDDVILVNADFVPALEGIWSKIDPGKRLVLLTDERDRPQTTLSLEGEYEELLALASPDHDFPDFDERARATLFYTTGTTGLPKGVSFSHRQLVLHTLALAAVIAAPRAGQRLHRDTVYMPLTPMFHVHAWGFPYVATLLGLKQVYPGRYAPDALASLIESEDVTFSHCVPTILHMLLSSEAAQSVDLSSWTVVVGGSHLPKGLAQAALARGIDVFTGYGMSETCPVLTLAQVKTHLRGDDELDVRVATGLPIPLVDVRVVDEKMRDLDRDGVSAGEVVVRAPWTTLAYVKDPQGSEELWRAGYLHTGDVGTIDGEGYLRVTDRLKDVIKTGGEWVSSLALESLISQHEAVGEVAVIGVADERWGERPLAVVVPKPGTSLAPDAIRAHVSTHAERGARYAVPERVEIVDELPKTSVGKLDKKALRARYSS